MIDNEFTLQIKVCSVTMVFLEHGLDNIGLLNHSQRERFITY